MMVAVVVEEVIVALVEGGIGGIHIACLSNCIQRFHLGAERGGGSNSTG
jgi:hypothetical protein